MGSTRCSRFPLGLALFFIGACSDGANDRPAFQPGRAFHDTAKIELTGFTGDPALQHRVLMMTFGEAAARLGSLRFEAVSNFEFSRGGETYEQRDQYAVRQDIDGNFYLRLDTPTSEVEYYLVGENVHVRLDKGPLRQGPRREVGTEAICEIAFSSIHQTLAPFRPRLQFTNPTPAELNGRTTHRFNLTLSKADQPLPARLPEAEGPLPTAPPPRWRELAQPLDLSGRIWVDKASGVVLKAEIRGRLEIPDRDVRPTQLTLAYSASISDIGKVTSIEVPESIAEFKRLPPPRDQLSFFREFLPPPPAPEEPPPATP